jgi:hypothetical protein
MANSQTWTSVKCKWLSLDTVCLISIIFTLKATRSVIAARIKGMSTPNTTTRFSAVPTQNIIMEQRHKYFYNVWDVSFSI